MMFFQKKKTLEVQFIDQIKKGMFQDEGEPLEAHAPKKQRSTPGNVVDSIPLGMMSPQGN